MGFDKNYKNRKDKRKPYYGREEIDATCRPGGDCPYGRGNRFHKRKLQEQDADEQIEEYLNAEEEEDII